MYHGFGFMWPAVWLGLGILAIILLMKVWHTDEKHHGRPASAADIVRGRYATGELTRDEFVRMMQVLRTSSEPKQVPTGRG